MHHVFGGKFAIQLFAKYRATGYRGTFTICNGMFYSEKNQKQSASEIAQK